jgi:purine nucleoside phosphorylase
MDPNETGEFMLAARSLTAVLVGCIGGSGLYHLDNLTVV